MNKRLMGILVSLILTVTLISIPVFAEPDGSGDQAGSGTEITAETPSDNETEENVGDDSENKDPENKDQDENQNQEDQGEGSDDSNTPGPDNPGDNTGNEEPGDNPGDIPGEEPTDEGQEDNWIPSLTKPESFSKCEDALIVRAVGTYELLIHDDEKLTEQEAAKVASGDLDVWHGYKYTEAKVNENPDPEPGDDPSDQPGDEPEDPETPEEPAKKVEVKYGSSALDLIDELGIGTSKLLVTIQGEGEETESKNLEVTVAKGEQKISVARTSYSVPIGTGSFSLGAKSNVKGAKLTYSSNNPGSVSVDANGNVTINGLTSGAAIITINAEGTDLYEAAPAVKVSISVTNPGAPTLTAKAIGKKKIQLNWSSVPGAVKYQVQPKLGKKKLKANNNITATTIKNTKLKKGKTYSYQVRAVVTVNGKTYYSPWSAAKKAKVK